MWLLNKAINNDRRALLSTGAPSSCRPYPSTDWNLPATAVLLLCQRVCLRDCLLLGLVAIHPVHPLLFDHLVDLRSSETSNELLHESPALWLSVLRLVLHVRLPHSS
eukprot:TRINITY_DN289_c0_g1_i3.p2 TRINITY_DN289_c0_g1~~TRINITY_DN289_c0_g1_i3.p2  ORF type:complete len:107 (-),score=4.69 TRINITY_DN289_c0_g1_i3:181-501(-)